MANHYAEVAEVIGIGYGCICTYNRAKAAV